MENIDEKNIREVTTTLPKDIVEYIKKQGYKYNELIRIGIKAKEGNPQLIERIKVLEHCIPRIEASLDLLLRNSMKDTKVDT